MKSFITRHRSRVKGILSGFDRVRFRGTLRWLANVRGLGAFLWKSKVLLKDFKDYAIGLTDTVRRATQRLAERAGRPVCYVASSAARKEEIARRIAAADRVTEGLVCVLTCVEPCLTFTVGPNAGMKRLELRSLEGKCLHQYFYFNDPQLGWLHVRLQTWLPFSVHIVLNGREWLGCQLRRAGVDYQQRENCFVDVADITKAQRLFDRQQQTNWSRMLDRLLRRVHPSHGRLFGQHQMRYYWSADETEWATDVLFTSKQALGNLYPRLVHHGITTFRSEDVLRFLGRRPVVQSFTAARLLSSVAARPEGTRIKHQLDRNSLKMYDKQESVLRIETTINNPRQMKSYRAKQNEPHGPKGWRGLRKGVSDLHRRAKLSEAANRRYLDALAAVDHPESLADSTRTLCQRTEWRGRSVRALNPLADEDARLFQAVAQGQFMIHGFRNRDLRFLLFGQTDCPLTRRRQAAKVTRMLRMLRAHRLIQKVCKSHRYVLTQNGRTKIIALLAARNANTEKLTKLAA